MFLFGSRYYQCAKGIFRIRSRRDCEEAVRAIFGRHEVPTRWSTRVFLKAMEETCVPGVLDPWCFQISHQPKEQHVHVMGTEIARRITRMEGDIAAADAAHATRPYRPLHAP